MKIIFERWWKNGTKYFGILNYKKYWIKPQFSFRTNGAKKRKGDKCFDCTLTIGYTVITYTNFNLQGRRVSNGKKKDSTN